jgi:two-component system sensor histidine kinase/response regulator
MKLWNKLLHLGIDEGLPYAQSREVKTINSINGFSAITLIILVVINLIGKKYFPAFVELMAIFLGTGLVYFFHYKRKYFSAKITLFAYTTSLCIIIAFFAIVNHHKVNTELILFAIALSAIMYFKGKTKHLVFWGSATAYYVIIFTKHLYWQVNSNYNFVFECVNAFVTFWAIYLVANRFKQYFLEYEQIILEKNTELSDLNQQKDKLFSIIAHDLRSPLSSLNQILSMLSEGNLTKKEFEMLIEKISKNSGYTSELLDNLLHWAGSQIKGFKVNRVEFNIEKVIEEKIALALPLYNVKNITVVNAVNHNTMVFADINMINIVLRNLLSNAIKFSRSNTTITVNAYKENEFVYVEVIDEGIGISKEEQKLLFNNISYTKPGTANEKGTGIGLPLCKEFVEKNGGAISVESQLGKGSTFTFTLPAA